MKFSVWPNANQPYEDVLDLAQWAAENNWYGLWYADHFIPHGDGDDTGPMHEVWAILGALAAVTKGIRLGPLVCGNTYRHPAVLLKQAVTVDHVSGGRVVLGLGAGWEQNEHQAYGIPFFTTAERPRPPRRGRPGHSRPPRSDRSFSRSWAPINPWTTPRSALDRSVRSRF